MLGPNPKPDEGLTDYALYSQMDEQLKALARSLTGKTLLLEQLRMNAIQDRMRTYPVDRLRGMMIEELKADLASSWHPVHLARPLETSSRYADFRAVSSYLQPTRVEFAKPAGDALLVEQVVRLIDVNKPPASEEKARMPKKLNRLVAAMKQAGQL